MEHSKEIPVYAVIAAAGMGQRAGFERNKLLTDLNGEPVIIKTVKKFIQPYISRVIISVSQTDYEDMYKLIRPLSEKVEFVIGGDTRSQSVYAALDKIDGGIVLIHDGARPYVSERIILQAIATVKKFGSAVAAVPACDTLCISSDGEITNYLPRQNTYNIQTPQGFFTNDLKKAYALAKKSYTDDSSIYADFIKRPRLFLGDSSNNKLTFKKDFKDTMNMHTGIGFDTHRLVKDRKLILGGVEIESDLGLLGHSDADALTHAIMDALLSSAGLKDIGCHFPESDERYKDASSIELLSEVVKKLSALNLKIKNISAVIVAQQPKLSPYIDEMKQNLSKVMHISTDSVGITVSTAEQMGFIGRSEGIAVTASCLTYSGE